MIRGLGPVPSFKTGKRGTFETTDSGKVYARPVTSRKHRKWMQRCIAVLRSELLYGSVTGEGVIQTAARARSLIASLPHDDCWTVIPILTITSELCEPGAEGATITIIKL